MNLDHFSTTVDAIVARDPRFERDAYLFVRDALEYTTKQLKKKSGASSGSPGECHVSSQQLLEGMRQYALQQYGPMVVTVFEHWRVRSCEDIGGIVFNLIEAREFGKSEHDTLEDFRQDLTSTRRSSRLSVRAGNRSWRRPGVGAHRLRPRNQFEAAR